MQNTSADLLANVAFKIIPSEEFSPDRFSIELIFRPSIHDNITNWRVFNDDTDIIDFLSSDGSYEGQIIDEHEHDLQIENKHDANQIPKSIVKMEDLYDLKDRFKKTTNSKTQSSTLRFEFINLGTLDKPQNINLGLGLTPDERMSFIKLLRKYKSIFARDYLDLKTYDTSIMQHTIPMISNDKPVQ